VESAHASYEKKNAELRLKPGNSLTLAQIAGKIKERGFTAKSAKVTVQGEVVRSGSKFYLKVSGSAESLEIAGDAQALATLVGRRVTMRGSVTPPHDLSEKTALKPSSDPIALSVFPSLPAAHL
jgi:hypothetical protein